MPPSTAAATTNRAAHPRYEPCGALALTAPRTLDSGLVSHRLEQQRVDQGPPPSGDAVFFGAVFVTVLASTPRRTTFPELFSAFWAAVCVAVLVLRRSAIDLCSSVWVWVLLFVGAGSLVHARYACSSCRSSSMARKQGAGLMV